MDEEFHLIMEDMSGKPVQPWRLYGTKKVVDQKIRYRPIEAWPGRSIYVKVCYHGRALEYPCGLCEYESQILRIEE